MLQVLQELSTGDTVLREVPPPAVSRGSLLIETRRSLISAGTERMLVEFGRGNLLQKALQQPERVSQVIDKARTDGIAATLSAVRTKLDEPLPLGYCNVGVVLEVGPEVTDFAAGDRVVSNGAHAQLVCAPRHLCARISDEVSDDAAAFTVLGAVALQGMRLAEPTLGERFVVIGLGLVGLLAVQLLRAAGCRVLGIDPDRRKVELARTFGAEVIAVDYSQDVERVAEAFSEGRGVDGVLIAAATNSSEPLSLSARMCRKRGRIVLVGVTGLELNRDDFYRKELTFQVSCSYGPGRYDPEYEQAGRDYPVGFVRWTEQRNLAAVLDMLALGRLDVEPLVSHRFKFQSAPEAYELLASETEPHLGIVLQYPQLPATAVRTPAIMLNGTPRPAASAGVEPAALFIGAGNYAGRVLIPAFVACGTRMAGIASRGGVSAAHYGRKFGFAVAASDPQAMLASSDASIVVIATRHDSHASLTLRALAAGKHTFVEKPLALTQQELDAVAAAAAGRSGTSRPLLMVGFNRRFAPHVVRMKSLLEPMREPKSIVITVNAGALPADHWLHDPRTGGGRLVGEGCHFVDLARFLAGQPIVDSGVRVLGRDSTRHEDDVSITLAFADGSWGAIHYLANGHRSYPKERIEVFCGGRVLQLDNFRRLRGYGWPGFSRMSSWRQDKGQQACVAAFVAAVRNGAPAPIALEELLEVSRVVVALGERARA
ncbi:MAG TPA: bi-domain-containing oxidoreductase [Steroidobacteraceae bacterium]|jgi:predicted dehydrogenase/threonine dehydrogenase-like Zn-dependent dehydrogenase|nr:bi-domain-containing oxidoreductase [Steroidobacteraceae bacterium]